MPSPNPVRPRLRPLDAQAIHYEGMAYLHLRDPLQLSEKTILVPQPLIPLLPLLDGTRTLLQLQVALSTHYNLRIGITHIENLISSLEEALLLETEHYQRAKDRALSEYRSAAFRPPALAGESYPLSSEDLNDLLNSFTQGIRSPSRLPNQFQIRGLITPHIDYPRGGPVYAEIWAAARCAAREAELVILLGTDHFSEGNPLTFTYQNYATPFGILPTDTELVDSLTASVGRDAAFLGELHHRREHSLELAAVWLQFVREGKPVNLLPILCGPFEAFEDSTGSLRNSPVIGSLVQSLRAICQERSTLVIAAGDLSHIGPAFGGDLVSPERLGQINQADADLLGTVIAGDAEGFYQTIRRTNDSSNVCGTSPIYTALRLLEPVTGHVLAYTSCPADTDQTSFVTIAGVALG